MSVIERNVLRRFSNPSFLISFMCNLHGAFHSTLLHEVADLLQTFYAVSIRKDYTQVLVTNIVDKLL